MAAASSSSGSSFTSSSLGRPPTYSRSYATPQTSLRHLDLGPPGYQATITLFQDTPDERTVYLGPWEVVGSEQRRVLWQCSYQNELLEHYLPSDIPSEIHPHTLHSRHRQYHDPSDMERYLTFPEPHRIRYTTDEGSASTTSTYKDMINYFDVDVVWTNVHGRTDGFGKVKGIGAIQRLKMWRDRYTTFHSISVLANKTDGQYREYDVHLFEANCAAVTTAQSKFGSTPQESPGPSQASVDIKHLSIQFSSRSDYRRFLEAWAYAHSTDRDFQGLPFPPNHFELPSPQMLPGQASELPSPELSRSLDPVLEPEDQDPRG
ncbi:hypothetical protein ACCO45_003213 [Purpureocillium lilacinum]|uniref:Uncharacterized protein n=1 Tax=Purpureocillium lilacinum TaxID=33203 RepID=A0ACC4DZ98_PURLI